MLVAVTPVAVAPPFPLLLVLLLLLFALLLLLPLLLLDEPQAASSKATATTNPTYASTLVLRNLIPLLLTVDPTGTERPSTRGI
ncbi:MAG TPA: hypothetical protein VMF57_14250 [Solirubrobacteraceae bacterium]|nr:hypothetical protein [Solirubrobacteraceae bacterium]